MSRNRGSDRGGFLKLARVALNGSASVNLVALPGKRWRIFSAAVQLYLNYDQVAAATSIPIPVAAATEFGDGTFTAERLNLFAVVVTTVLVECYET